MAPRMRSLGLGGLALTIAFFVSGCSFGTTTGPTIAWTTRTPAPTASATPRPTIEPPVLDVGTVVATGTLVGDPLVSGDAAVVVNEAGTFELQLLDYRSTYTGEVYVRFSPRPVQPGTVCTSGIMTIGFGSPTTEPVQRFPLMKDFTDGDPSFLDTVIIEANDPAAKQDCFVPIVASAILDWTIPDMRPGLTVTDAGKTGGANGEVVLVDGVPTSYTVTHNDLAEEVAARFGITVKDLFYLNPIRIARVAYPLLEANEVLNLSKANR